MSRYSSIQITNRWDGKRVYKSVEYPVIVPQDTDVQIVSQESDFLDTLALKYYGDPEKYWIIGRANNLGRGRLSIPPGTNLRIPLDVGSIMAEYNRLNLV
jgi:nucleoid-associated protein YgaU